MRLNRSDCFMIVALVAVQLLRGNLVGKDSRQRVFAMLKFSDRAQLG